MGGFSQPVNQNYQTDDQFYDTQNGGQFDSYGQGFSDDQINDELDRLLDVSAPAVQDGATNTTPVSDGNINLFLEEQRQQREFERQQADARRRQEDLDRKSQQSQLERERLKQEAETKTKVYRPQFNNIALTEEQKKVYADADPYIRSVVQEILGSVWDANITPALTEHQQSILDLAKRPTEFSLSVEQQVAISRPNVNGVVAEPEFARYLAEPVEGTGMTRRDIMNIAYQRGDANAVVTMLDTYTANKEKSRPNRTASPTASVHSAPQGGGQGGAKRARPYSELTKAQSLFRQGRITRDKLVEIEDRFEALASNGLVDYNK